MSHDTIQAYLDSPLVPDVQISYLCLPPASSVDAERSFSCGRLQVNHLQHNIGSQSFKAQMAVGSWLQTPLLSIDHVTNVIRDGMSHSHSKGKSRAVDDSDDIIMVDP